MPNWVYNYLEVDGTAQDIAKIKSQLNTPFFRTHDNWNPETNQMEQKEYFYANPIFAFWNIIAPTNLEAYNKQADRDIPLAEQLMFQGENWYDFNVRNWGTKWDVAVGNDEQYPETELYEESETQLCYKFNTAWSPPQPAIQNLSEQYPDVTFTLSYEEETGWGGEIEFNAGETAVLEDYENKCRDCDSLNTLEYCENDCGEICSACHSMAEADLEYVAECEEHKMYLMGVPDYRMETAKKIAKEKGIIV